MLKLLSVFLLAIWLIATIVGVPLIASAGSLMSLDEEWDGWGALLLNPYIAGPYATLSLATALCLKLSGLFSGVDNHDDE